MKDIKQLRKLSYYKLQTYYYQLLYNREVELSCLNKNYELYKEISKSYFLDEGHDLENDIIYENERQAFNFCLTNIKEYKRLNEEINEVKQKVLKAESKL